MTPPTVPEAGPQPVEGSRAQCVACDNELIDGQCPIHGDLTARAQDVPMTPPSSPRAGRSTVSTAGEARRTCLHGIEADCEKCWWIRTHEHRFDLFAPMDAVCTASDCTVTRRRAIEAEAAASFDTRNQAAERLLARISVETDRNTDYIALRDLLDAALSEERRLTAAGPEAVPQSEREGLPNRDLLAEAIFESGVRQSMSQSEMAADNILAEMSILLARLASPAHPDEE
jgi:hypothetical protein